MKKYLIRSESTLLECVRVIDRSGAGIALAVDHELRLIGTVSDGDIRRALIKGFGLESPVLPHINRDCFSVSPSVSRTEVLEIMQARRFEQVPVIDEDRKVVGLHLLHDIVGRIDRPNWAVIMAGGKGTRLRPLTERIPKSMLKVAGRPILERIILHFISYGIHQIFLAVNYLGHIIEDYFEDGSTYGCRIEYLREDEPLGSGGALALLPEVPKHSLLVMNGDLIVDFNIARMLDFHDQNGFYATMAVHPYTHEVPFGCTEIQDGRLVGLDEKPILEKTVNAGIYVLSPEAVEAVPKSTYFPITNLFEYALERDLVCGAFHIEREWLDIGEPKKLKQARGEV